MLMSKILKAGMVSFILIWLVLCGWVFIASAVDFTLAWDAPTTNTDGTPLTDLAGYKVYYGTASGVYGSPITVGNVLTHTVTGLLGDRLYFFAVTARDTSGNESGYSNEVSKTKTSIPSAPILRTVMYTSLNNFTDLIVGKEVYKLMTMRNDSGSKLTISQIAVEGDFRITTALPKILDAGKSTTVRVYFRPIEKGLRLGKISIVSDKGTVEKGLSGNGV